MKLESEKIHEGSNSLNPGITWKVKKIKELLAENGYIRGPFGSALRRPELKIQGIPVYEQQHAIYNSREFRYFIDKKKFIELSRFLVKTNDIIISCSGTIGKTSIIKEDDPKGIISQALLIMRPNSNIVRALFLKYFFESTTGYNSIISRSFGSVQVNIAKREVIENIEIKIPSLTEQDNIVRILSSVDSKIELNQQLNKTLESIAQAIFKHWFIDFEFPDENGQPYKSSGGEMVDSEIGMMPIEWKIGKIKDFAIVTSGKRPGKKTIFRTDEFNVALIGASSVMGYVKENLYTNKIIVTGRVGTHGIIQRINYPSWPSDNTLVLKPNYYEYVFQCMKLIDFDTLNVGSTQPLITQTQIKEWKIAIPSKETLESFERIASSFYTKVESNIDQNRTLSSLRDLLLPYLISGKIRVPLEDKNV